MAIATFFLYRQSVFFVNEHFFSTDSLMGIGAMPYDLD